jgi:NitT/TauT family transport system substrate-binding protein
MKLAKLAFTLALVAGSALSGAVHAETSTLKITQQFSMAFLQLNVIEHQNLVEKHAKALGIPNLKVEWTKVAGVNTLNDLLLSGSVDVVAGSPPGLITLWAATAGTPREARAISALSTFPIVLTTRNPNIKSLRDYTPASRISVAGGIKISAAAIVLQMASIKEFGEANWNKLDAQTISLPVPDATAGMLAGTGDFDSTMGPPPFANIQLKDPKIRRVLDSYDVVGPVTQAVLWTSKKFHDENPTVYKAFLNAVTEASEFVEANRREAISYYIKSSGAKFEVDELESYIADRERNRFGIVPTGTMMYATFMNKVGTIKRQPDSWKDLYFPEIWHLPGN